MSERETVDEPFEFELPDATAGGDPLTAAGLAAEHDAVVALLLGDHLCPDSRAFVREVRDRHEAFARRSAAVVAVLPDRVELASVWGRRYGLPFPMLADADDPDSEAPDLDAFAAPARRLDRPPGAALFASDGENLHLARVAGGDAPDDVPDPGALLATLDGWTPATVEGGESGVSVTDR